MISPVGSQFQLNCSVAVGHRVLWAVSITPVDRELLTSDSVDVELLRQHGIIVRELSDHSSQLVVNPTTVQLVNYIDCIAQDNNGVRTRGQRVNVTIYGKYIYCSLIVDGCIRNSQVPPHLLLMLCSHHSQSTPSELVGPLLPPLLE